jgi:hypothetical protein
MATYRYGGGMTDEKAKKLIKAAFPKWPRPRKENIKWTSVHDLCDALLYARIKCASEAVEKCIRWAYNESKKE